MDNNRIDLWLYILIGSLIYIAVCSLLTSCKSVRESVEDSVRTEIRYKEIVRTDTAYVTLPSQTVERVTRDTVSRLETDYAWSVAMVDSEGLHHTLSTKEAPVAVRVLSKDVVRDSIVYKDKILTETKEVAKPLTWWQKTQMYGFRLCVMALCGWLLYRVARRVITK